MKQGEFGLQLFILFLFIILAGVLALYLNITSEEEIALPQEEEKEPEIIIAPPILECPFDMGTICRVDGSAKNLEAFPLVGDQLSFGKYGIEGNSATIDANLQELILEDFSYPEFGTISMWIKLEDIQGEHYILSNGKDFNIYINEQTLHYQLGKDVLTMPLDQLNLRQFHQLIFRWGRASMTIILDKKEIMEKDKQIGTKLSDGLIIGNKPILSTSPLNGQLDELKLFDYIVTNEELEAI